MKTLKLKWLLVATGLFLLCSFTAIPTHRLEGTWKYKVPEAPYNYQSGMLTFKKEDHKWTGTMDMNGDSQKVQNLKVEKKKVSFTIWVQGTEVHVDISLQHHNKFSGTVTYSEGELKITGQKK